MNVCTVTRLQLVFNVESYEYTDLNDGGTGLFATFHDTERDIPLIPELLHGIQLATGTHARINVRHSEVRLCAPLYDKVAWKLMIDQPGTCFITLSDINLFPNTLFAIWYHHFIPAMLSLFLHFLRNQNARP